MAAPLANRFTLEALQHPAARKESGAKVTSWPQSSGRLLRLGKGRRGGHDGKTRSGDSLCIVNPPRSCVAATFQMADPLSMRGLP